MKATVVQGSCCAWQTIYQAADLLRSFPDSFDEACKKGHGLSAQTMAEYKGEHITATVVAIRADYADSMPNYKNTRANLTKRGFKLLGTFPGAHQTIGHEYKMEMWGLGFTLPGEK